MVRSELNPNLAWVPVESRDYGTYNQIRAYGLLGNQAVLDELFDSSLPNHHKNSAAQVLDDVACTMMDVLNLGGVVTVDGRISLGLPDNLRQANPEAFELIHTNFILEGRGLTAYPWSALGTFTGEDFSRNFYKSYKRFIVVSGGTDQQLFHNGKKVYLATGDRSRVYSGPEAFADIFRAHILQAYQKAHVPAYIAPMTIARQTIFDISNDIGLGRRDDLYRNWNSNERRLRFVDDEFSDDTFGLK